MYGEKKQGFVGLRVIQDMEERLEKMVRETGLGRSEIARLALFDFLSGGQEKRRVIVKIINLRKKNPSLYSLPWELKHQISEGL